GLPPALAVRGRRVAADGPARGVPPDVAQVQVARAVQAGCGLEPRIDARHERGEEPAPRAAAHADTVLVHLRARLEVGDGFEQRDRAVVDRGLLRVVAQVEADVDRIVARRAVAGVGEVDTKHRVAAPGARLGPVGARL